VKTVGDNIRAIRQARSVTQSELADGFDVRQPATWKYEKATNPKIKTLLRLAVRLATPLDEFVAGVDPAYDALVADRYQNIIALTPPTKVFTNSSSDHVPRDVNAAASETRRARASLEDIADARREALVRLAEVVRLLDPHLKITKARAPTPRSGRRRRAARR